MPTRIINTITSIDYSATQEFFEARSTKSDTSHPYTTVCYQDAQPDIAIQRDQHEKTTISQYLKITPQSRILDIGCGIGRWADTLGPLCQAYLGIDFSHGLLEQAKKRTPQHLQQRIFFQQLAAQNLATVTPDWFAVSPPFTCCILSGILLYLNDDDVRSCLSALTTLLDSHSLIYIREPIGTVDRLTLKNHYSDELKATYNAIYRTVDEYKEFLTQTLFPKEFSLLHEGHLLPQALQNRSDTTQYYFILHR